MTDRSKRNITPNKEYIRVISSCKECPNHKYLEHPGDNYYEYCVAKTTIRENGQRYGTEIKSYPKIPKWCPLGDAR